MGLMDRLIGLSDEEIQRLINADQEYKRDTFTRRDAQRSPARAALDPRTAGRTTQPGITGRIGGVLEQLQKSFTENTIPEDLRQGLRARGFPGKAADVASYFTEMYPGVAVPEALAHYRKNPDSAWSAIQLLSSFFPAVGRLTKTLDEDSPATPIEPPAKPGYPKRSSYPKEGWAEYQKAVDKYRAEHPEAFLPDNPPAVAEEPPTAAPAPQAPTNPPGYPTRPSYPPEGWKAYQDKVDAFKAAHPEIYGPSPPGPPEPPPPPPSDGGGGGSGGGNPPGYPRRPSYPPEGWAAWQKKVDTYKAMRDPAPPAPPSPLPLSEEELGGVLGEVEAAAAPPGGLLNQVAADTTITAYHGSPFDFPPEEGAPLGRFRDTQIGTGEGATAFGQGHYLAETEATARTYRDRLSRAKNMQSTITLPDGTDIPANKSTPAQSLAAGAAQWAKDRTRSWSSPNDKRVGGNETETAIGYLDDMAKSPFWSSNSVDANGPQAKIYTPAVIAEAKELVKAGIKYRPPGRIYETRIHADPEKFLDYDKKLADQPKEMQDAILKLAGEVDLSKNRSPLAQALNENLRKGNLNLSGDQAYTGLGGFGPEGQAAATEAMKKAGIPGIKYLDEMSRTTDPKWKQPQTRNYVVFDPKLIEIVKKYGLAAAVASGIVSEEMGRQMQEQGEI